MDKEILFLEIAKKVSLMSKDTSTKVGSVATDDSYRILSIGYNGFPSKYPDNYNISREKKLGITIHAEINAILNAAKNGVSLQDSIMFVSEPPCSNCAAAMINAGIKRVIYPQKYSLSDSWNESLLLSMELFKECNIIVDVKDI